jgi:hypothetical protein
MKRWGQSNRKITWALRISHPVVRQYITDVRAAGLMYTDGEGLSYNKDKKCYKFIIFEIFPDFLHLQDDESKNVFGIMSETGS